MKKASVKGKKDPSKGLQKISTFFTASGTSSKPKDKAPKASESVIVLDSDDDFKETKTKDSETKTITKKRKLNAHEDTENEHTASTKAINPTTSKDDETRRPLQTIELKTPEKYRGDDAKMKSAEKAKSSGKKSPLKLFEKSPRKVQEFNVQILDSFVKITPSKVSGTKRPRCISTTPEKIQTSILSYISPSTSNRSSIAQEFNEKTPTKEGKKDHMRSPGVKTKLDFSDCKENLASSQIDLNAGPSCSLADDFDEIFANTWSPDVSWRETEGHLDLTESQHCQIEELHKIPTGVIVKVKSTKNEEWANCTIEGFWINSKFLVGDKVHIKAAKVDGFWLVNNEYGLIVYEPDLLISSTSVVTSLFCKRRNVLAEKFHGFEPCNKAMVVGTLVHSLLDEVLKKKITSAPGMEAVLQKLTTSDDSIYRLYESNLSIQEIQEEMMKYIPNLVAFVENYMQPYANKSRRQIKKEDWKGVIDSVEDIEENIWCPELGIKGKVDVSIKSNSNYMPLELKTGRASISLEHRGQVLLYIMMMNKLGLNAPSGLLLYLKEGVLRDIPMSHKEKRDIMILRNELAYYLTRKPTVIKESQEKKKIRPPELPEPINHHSACLKCPYSTICTSYLKAEEFDLSNNKILNQIQSEVSTDLSQQHLDYFLHWSSLISLECGSEVKGKEVREIYTKSPKEREEKGQCISNLKLTNVGPECNGLRDHVFEKVEELGTNFLSCGISESKYVVISTTSRPAIASGFVTHVDAKTITISLDRDLSVKFKNQRIHVDSYDSNFTQSFNLTSLAVLLELSPRSEQLRRLIIDKETPKFRAKLPKIILTKGREILKGLNKTQQRAVLKAISAEDYLLIKGMPGTGKTSTIVALVQLLVELGRSVLITSHTHTAVDNVCLKLLERKVEVLRLGSESRFDKNLAAHSERRQIRKCKTPEEIGEVYDKAKVVAVTCLGSSHPLLSKRTFDICIIDESTQVLQSTVIRSMYAAKTCVFVGDPHQLPPLVRNKDAVDLGMAVSLFERLIDSGGTVTLDMNYRMNQTITNLANHLTYEGKLLVANEAVSKACLTLPKYQINEKPYKENSWIDRALSTELEDSVKVLDTGPVYKLQYSVPWFIKNGENAGIRCINIYEAAVIHKLITALTEGGVLPKDIGIIASYNAQVAQLSAILPIENLDISTVDQFQGKDKDVIIYSCSRSRSGQISMDDILGDCRRINVAITRAKHKLIIVGDCSTVSKYAPFGCIFDGLESKHVIKLEDTDDFKWTDLFELPI